MTQMNRDKGKRKGRKQIHIRR
ncbi:hypothetical protein PMI15_01594, partial [Polaromonas sp. CF318]